MNRDKIERLKRSAIAMRERFPNANEAMQALPVETIIELCNIGDALREQMEKAEAKLTAIREAVASYDWTRRDADSYHSAQRMRDTLKNILKLLE